MRFQYPPLLKPTLTTLLWKIYLSTCFYWLKPIRRGFTPLREEAKSEIVFSACFAVKGSRSSLHPELWQRHCPAPSLGTALSVSAWSTPVWNCVSICALSSFIWCAVSKLCPKELLLHFIPFRMMKIFTGTLYSQIVGESCVKLNA